MAKILKSLMRLKCASKSNFNWVPKHFLHSLQENLPFSNSNSILVNRRNIQNGKTILSLITGTDDLDLSVVNFDSFPSYLLLNIRGHTHNKVCLSDKQNNIFLFDMATREFSQLPPSIILPPRPHHTESSLDDEVDAYSTAVGFGYDKVVRVVDFCNDYFTYCYRTEIYDFSTNRWREIQTYLYDFIPINVPFEMYDGSRGVYYWCACNIKTESTSLLLFNMSEEKFSWIPLPDAVESSYSTSMGLWNGSIVLFIYPTSDRTTFEIWVIIEESGWSKAFTIDSSGIDKPLQFLNSDQLLMIAKDGHLVSYNVKSKQFNYLPGTFGSYIF